MSTQQNKHVVQEGYQHYGAGEITKVLALYHDDAEWVSPESALVPYSGNYHGKSEIAQFFAKLDAAVQTLRFEPRQFIAEGDKVVVLGEAGWQAKATGRKFDSPWVHVFTLRDGKVSRFEAFYDTAASEKAFQATQPGQAAGSASMRH